MNKELPRLRLVDGMWVVLIPRNYPHRISHGVTKRETALITAAQSYVMQRNYAEQRGYTHYTWAAKDWGDI